jgi:hypothetical protein
MLKKISVKPLPLRGIRISRDFPPFHGGKSLETLLLPLPLEGGRGDGNLFSILEKAAKK